MLKTRVPRFGPGGVGHPGAGPGRAGDLAAHVAGLGVLVLLMALGALCSSRRIWLLISVVNNLALLLFFKYAAVRRRELNALFAWVHARSSCPTRPR